MLECPLQSHEAREGKLSTEHPKQRAPTPNLCTLLSPDSKGEESRFLGVPGHFELCKSSCMSLDGLADLSLHRVQLHVSGHTMLLCRDANQQQPLECLVGTIVDDLAPNKTGVAVKYLLRLRFT